MKVTVSVAGRFHGFNLAAELERLGALDRLLTTYPAFTTSAYGIPKARVRSFTVKEVVERLHRKLPKQLQSPRVEPQLREWYDLWSSRNVGKSDVCTAWSGSALHTHIAARRTGALTVLERGSAHIVAQRDILAEEYERWGGKPALPHPRTIEKELQEYEEADLIAVPSAFVKKTFRDRGFPEGKLLHVPYGVDLSKFKRKTKHPETERPFRYIHCGAFSLRKGAHYLLEAFSELSLSNSELWVVGSIVDELRPFIQRYESPNITFFGIMPQSQLPDYYSECDVFVLMSLEEGLAMVIPQAMACELPVICTENTGGADLIDHNQGFILPIRNVDRIKEAMLWCYENRESCRAMGQAARKRVQSGHSWQDYGRRTFAGYQTALSSRTVSA